MSGGFAATVAGIAIKARDPWRPLILAVVLLIAEVALHRDGWIDALDRIGAGLARWSAALACGLAVLLTAHALYLGTFTAAGADAYGYMARRTGWARGELPGPPRVALALPLRESDVLQMPLGYAAGVSRTQLSRRTLPACRC